MKKPHLLLFFILVCFCMQGLGQNRFIDSLRNVLKAEKEDTNKVNTLDNLAFSLYRSVPDSTIALAQQACALATKLGWTKGEASSYRVIGIGYLVKNELPKALDFLLQGLKIAEELGDKQIQSKIIGNIGVVYFYEGDYPKTLDYDLKALKISEELGNKQTQANNLGNIGNVYHDMNEFDKALEYDLKALNLEEELGNKEEEASDICNIGNIYDAQRQYAKALDYYLKALKIAEELGDKETQAKTLCNMGNVYKMQGNPQALDYYIKSLKIAEEVGDKEVQANNLDNMGMYYIKTGKNKEAEQCFKKSIAIDSTAGNLDDLRIVEGAISGLYDTTGRYKLALEYFKKAMALKDTLFNIDKNKAMTRKEVTYQFEKKEAAEKAEQDRKDAVAIADKHKQAILVWAILGGLLLALVFAAFIFRSLRITRKQKQVIEIKNIETEKQKALIEQQKLLVEEKNKDILDSIVYAKRLQDAILPPLSIIKQYLPESFVFYKPKDIVAGDFYWMEKTGDNIMIAAADCTGHGVPGALVSVVCSNALNRTVKEFKITEPGRILDKVRELVRETFEKSEDNVQDGMDISLCCINTKTKEAQWSGAYNSLWIIRNGEVNEVPADKQPIGKVDKPIPFNTHNLSLQKDDTLYLFTDGYADQFGGTKGKKFKYKQLQELLLTNVGKALEEQKNVLGAILEEWKGNLEQVDDILVIGIRV